MMAVEMAANEDAKSRTGAPAGLLGELEREAVGGDDVIAADDAFVLDADDLIEIDAADGHERRGGSGWGTGEVGVEGRQEAVPQVVGGGGDGGAAGEAKLVVEAAL